MEDGFSSRHAFGERSLPFRKTVVVNSEYAVVYADDEVHVLRLANPDEEPQHLRCPRISGWRKPIFNLSVGSSNMLAVSVGPLIYIFDLNNCSLKHILPGTGRTVTSVAFSIQNSKWITTGHIDGSICLWDSDFSNRPLTCLISAGALCNALAFCPENENFLASIHNGKILIWSFTRRVDRPICTLDGCQFDTFAWHPQTAGHLIASSADRELRLYDLSDIVKFPNTSISSNNRSDEENDGEFFGQPDDLRAELLPRMKLAIGTKLSSLIWVGDKTVLGLDNGGEDVFVYELENNVPRLTHVWSCKFQNAVDAVQILKHDRVATILGIWNHYISYQDIPESIADRIQFEHHSTNPLSALAVAEDARASTPESVLEVRVKEAQISPTMNPISIATRRAEASAFERTSKQLQQTRRSSRWKKTTKKVTEGGEFEIQTKQSPNISPTRSLTSDVELSIFPNDDDIGSPMPFLSPGIPSNRIPRDDTYFVDGGTTAFTALPASSFESFREPTAAVPLNGQDTDDSDDETFVGDMRESAAFLPGGINVPLPKACGALFAPNGQLLTFFPPKPKLVSARDTAEAEPREGSRKGEEVAKVFPKFGNLESDFGSFENSDPNDSPLLDEKEGENRQLPMFSFQPTSFHSQLSWKSRETAAQPLVYDHHARHKIVVSIHEIADVTPLHPARRDVAKEYRLLCKAGESGFELCEHNAKVAEAVGLQDISGIWRLLALLLEDQVPLELHSLNSSEDILTIARRARQLTVSGSDSMRSSKDYNVSGKLRWAGHVFGKLWLIRQALRWAERCADVQSLACFAAVLSTVESNVPIKYPTAEHSMLQHLPTYSVDYFTEATAKTSSQVTKRTIPVLRTHAATITALHDSPTKLLRESNLASRLPPQPSTPYLGSDSTPPFPSPILSRQSTRLSTSGSASPEFQRGSFSAAAKYYAHSISEKFASYGTSPPAKKDSSSPTANTELSTSLPSGSWPGKSVSFASSTTDDTTRSMSVSAYRARHDEDGYDSDKTIEDTSGPPTPKSPRSGVVLNFNNQDKFTDEISGSSKMDLVPEDLAEKATIWVQYYGELLRSWGMLEQATELEKVAGLTSGKASQFAFPDLGNAVILPTAVSTRRTIFCNICFTATKGVLQTCPSCLHSSHIQCLEEYGNELADGEFTCASGCGCLCSDLPFVVPDNPAQSPQRPTFKKKASYTDPRRWRARVEGDSW